jgi:alpha-tubulin suppressor-like RCC1 family protein
LPNTPSSITITVISSSQVVLTWTNTAYEQGYKIERKTGVSGTYEQIGTTNIDVISYTDAGLFSPSTLYYYHVSAYNNLGESNYSSEGYTSIWGNWDNIAAGLKHTIACKTNGTIWSWGNNVDGQLGLGDTSNRYTPVQIGIDSDWSKIKAGPLHTTVLKTNKTIWLWGDNSYGQLGFGDTDDRNRPNQLGGIPNPHPALTATLTSLSQIDLSWSDTNDENEFQILRNGELLITQSANTVAYSDTTVISNTSYSYRIKAVNNAGEIFSLAASLNVIDANIGNSAVVNSFPTPGLDSDWSVIAAGRGNYGHHTLAIKDNGTLWSWGYNDYGQLGLGYSYPIPITIPNQIGSDSDWSDISAGDRHSLARKSNGTIWGWGYNNDGQLGDGTNTTRILPRQIGTKSDWANVSAGGNNSGSHSVAIKTNGTIWSWGNNDYGQLGLGDSGTDKETPTQTGIDSDWSDIVAGTIHTFALKTNGTIWAWGANNYGQLGDGTVTNRNTPMQIGNASDGSVISAGDNSLVRKNNGTLWVWGLNDKGQLGLGDTNIKYTPTLVGE